MQRDAVAGVEVTIDRADPFAEGAGERHRAHLDQRDLDTHLPGGCRNFGAQPARTDHHDAVGPLECGPEAVRIGEATQQVHPWQVTAPDRQGAWFGPGGQEQPVPAHGGAVAERHMPAIDVDGGHGRAEDEVDVKLGPPVGVEDADVVRARLAPQVLLGQGRPVVGQIGLVADEDDAPVEALLPQGTRGVGAGKAGTDDDVGRGCSHGVAPVASRRRQLVAAADGKGRASRGTTAANRARVSAPSSSPKSRRATS